MVLQAIVFPEEVAVALFARRRIPWVIEQVGQASLDFFSGGDGSEKVGGQLILLCHPRLRFGGIGILEPAIGVWNFDAVIDVNCGILSGRWVN